MRATLYQVVTFADHVFRGNPAHVLTLDKEPDPSLMTAACGLVGADVLAVITRPADATPALSFFTSKGPHPGAGHATLAAAHIALNDAGSGRTGLSLKLADGSLREVRRDAHGIAVEWPVMTYETTGRRDQIADALGVSPAECFVSAFGYVAVLASEGEVSSLAPNLTRVAELDRSALIVTAPGIDSGCVIRVFAPQVGLPEDPVCGTAHRIIVPYWAKRLGKASIHSRHLSPRGGDLWCTIKANTVTIAGESKTAFEGTIYLPDQV